MKMTGLSLLHFRKLSNHTVDGVCNKVAMSIASVIFTLSVSYWLQLIGIIPTKQCQWFL